jgi:predicted nucleic acid-binding protein
VPHFLDTNILVYSISTKSDDIAVGLLAAWTPFKIQEITLSIVTGALEINAARGFSYWDSAVIAAARSWP